MSFMFLVGVLNLGLRSIFMLCMIYGLIRLGAGLNLLQRAGMGFAGGAALMTIPPAWAYYFTSNDATPFDGWSTSILMIGCIMFFLATMRRYRNHERANAEQARRSLAHLESRGKL